MNADQVAGYSIILACVGWLIIQTLALLLPERDHDQSLER